MRGRGSDLIMLNPQGPEPSLVDGVDPAPKPTRRSFTAEYREGVVVEYEAAPHGKKSAVLRREGIHQTQVAEWARARDAAAGEPYRRDRKPRSKHSSAHISHFLLAKILRQRQGRKPLRREEWCIRRDRKRQRSGRREAPSTRGRWCFGIRTRSCSFPRHPATTYACIVYLLLSVMPPLCTGRTSTPPVRVRTAGFKRAIATAAVRSRASTT